MSPQKFCRNCGRALSVAEQFCSACGSKLDEANTPRTTTVIDRSHERSVLSTSEHSTRPGVFLSWKLLAAVVIVIVAAFLYTKLRSTGATSTAIPPDHQTLVARQIDSLRDIVQRNPLDAHALVQLANEYYDTQMFPEAIQVYTRYLQIQPSDADARVDLGVAYFNLSFDDSLHRAEDIQHSKDEMEKAITYQPKHQLAYFNLGIVTLHSGDVGKASEWFQKCVAIDSTSEAGRTARQFLSQHQTIKRQTS